MSRWPRVLVMNLDIVVSKADIQVLYPSYLEAGMQHLDIGSKKIESRCLLGPGPTGTDV